MGTTCKRQYLSMLRRVKPLMKERMEQLRQRVAEVLGNKCSVSSLYDWIDDEFNLDFVVYYGPKKEKDEELCLDVKLYLTDSVAREGGPDPGKPYEGVGVLMDIVHYGGSILGGYCPDNYTNRVWSKDEEETRQRLEFDVDETAFYIAQRALDYQTGKRT